MYRTFALHVDGDAAVQARIGDQYVQIGDFALLDAFRCLFKSIN